MDGSLLGGRENKSESSICGKVSLGQEGGGREGGQGGKATFMLSRPSVVVVLWDSCGWMR